MSDQVPAAGAIDEQAEAIAAFLARHVKPYDSITDDYDRPPFASDIKEGKNDPIYNVHHYHTKVPPRSIIPYILHYTKPGELVLDVFCGSGMTGVAAQICVNPPADILTQFPELADRVGPRVCILNDLSPAACHIAYNYNTPVDVDSLRHEFERIKAAVKDEFDWLYGTEHYEPAVGLYAPSNPDVASRLKNPPGAGSQNTLFSGEDHTWELLSKAEVERRLGYPVNELPRFVEWSELDVSTVEHWVCIPAMIQYTIWADVCRCEGFVTTEESTGKVSRRGKNAGRQIVQKRSVARGCGQEFSLYDVAMDKETTKVIERFHCPGCQQEWEVNDVTVLRAEAHQIVYQFVSLRKRANGDLAVQRVRRALSARDRRRLEEIEGCSVPYWYPRTPLVPGEQGNPFIARGLVSVDQLYTPRSLRASSRLWQEFVSVADARVRAALQFLFTSVSARNLTRMTRYRKRGNEALAMRLFIPHFQAELNPLKVLGGKFDDIATYFAAGCFVKNSVLAIAGPAQEIHWLSDASVDFIFADPPFGRNIAYAELNVLWESWLGRTTDVPKEAITSNGRKWNVESYVEKMRGAFREMFRVLKPGRYALIEFNNGDPALGLFEHIKQAALAAGFQITNMMILDKEHKSFNQVVGVMRGEDTVDKDVVFNLRRPVGIHNDFLSEDEDLEQQIADAVRQHLQTLPDRIEADAGKYSDEHRTTATIHSMLMNTLIPKGVGVQRLNPQMIQRVCARYFRKVGQRWYLRGQAVGNGTNKEGLFEEDVQIGDEVTAIDWLRQKLHCAPMLIGELKPLWMRATGLLPSAVSQTMSLEDLLAENFWRDQDTNRWREPTDEERERMNDDRSIRTLHDAERFIAGSLRRETTDAERCDWIDVLFKTCREVEDGDTQSTPAMRGFDCGEGFRLIARLFQTILTEKVPAGDFTRAQKQAAAASKRISQEVRDDDKRRQADAGKKRGPTLFDLEDVT